jgi:hypothetical protein
LSDEKYITASCVISENAVHKNGKFVFENKDADVHSFLISIYQYLEVNYPKFYKMDNLSKLGWLASEILLKDEHIKDNYRPEETGIVISNADSSLDTDLKYFETVKDMPSPALFVYTLPNIMIGEISIRNNFKGENAFFIFEQFDADFIEQYVSNLLNNNNLQVCICGWVELLKEEYKAALFLVEKVKREGSNLFTKEQIGNVFKEPGYINAKI